MSVFRNSSGFSGASVAHVLRAFRVDALLLLSVALASGCSGLRPTLHVAYNDPAPLPNNLIESQIWGKARPLRVTLTQGGGLSLSAEIRAVHDDRAISFLISWPDQSPSVISKVWVHPATDAPWRLEDITNDSLRLIFPLTQGAPLDIFSGLNSQYDVWQWQGGAWSNESGYADDGRLIVKYHPGPKPPDRHDGTIYPSADGSGFIEQTWHDDDGNPGTITRPQPLPYEPKTIIPAAIPNPYAGGSAIDVRVLGTFNRQEAKTRTAFWTKRDGRVSGYWFGDTPPENNPGSYSVRYYRLFRTESPDEDYQFEGPGPHPFALTIVDNRAGAQPFVSAPLRLMLDKPPQ